MKSHFSAEFFRENRARLRKLFAGTAPIVITANGLVQRNGDVNFPFRQDSNFWYLTGLSEPDLLLVMDKDKEYLILPEREAWRDISEGPLDTKALKNRSGIQKIYDNKDGWKQLSSRLIKAKHLATVPPSKNLKKHYGIYPNPARTTLIKAAKKINPDIKPLDLNPQFIKLRTIKRPEELAAIQEAIDITNVALKKVKRQLKRLNSERQIEIMLDEAYKMNDSMHSFTPVIAGGLNACTIHYQDNNQKLKAKDLVLIDTGAEVENYAADITRTYSLSAPTKRQQAVFDAVKDVQKYAISLLKPGANYIEYEKKVEHYMGEKLRELGVIKSISRENVRRYFPTATSHFLGLDVHDIGDYHQPLTAGMVVTVEPGIYIKEEKIGVRLEDDVLITKNGPKVLSADLPLKLS